MNVSALGNVWQLATLDSAEELTDIVNLARQISFNLCFCGNGTFGIDGSTNVESLKDFEFSDGYIPNSSGNNIIKLQFSRI